MENISHLNLTDEQILEKIQKEKNKLRFLLPSLALKLRYKLWLVSIREVSILIQLIPHYKEIPEKTPTKLIVGLFVKSSLMKNLLFAVEKRLRKRIY